MAAFAIVILILVATFFAGLAMYYWAKAQYFRAEWKATFEPLDPPNISNRNPDIERFWDYASDSSDNDGGFEGRT